jgi:CheY-like chemotaxis protein
MSTPKRIIVADDDSKIRQLLEHALRAPEFEVHTFRTGAEALAALPRLRPDCVVSDMLMPDMDGEKLLRAVRGLPGLERVPFLVVSAIRSEARIQRVLEAGAAAFMLKPFPVRDLAEKIRDVTDAATVEQTLEEASLPELDLPGDLGIPEGVPAEQAPPLPLHFEDPPPPGPRQTELSPTSTVLGFGRYTKVEQIRRSFVVLTEIELAPRFTITTVISERGIGRRRLQSSLLHPLTRDEDRELIRKQVDRQHEDVIERLPELVLEGGAREVVWSDRSRSVDPGLLAWTVSALAQRAEAEAGVVETVRVLRRTLEQAALNDDTLRVFGVTDLGRVIVEPGHGERLPRRAVDSVARWCVAFAAESLQAERRDVLEPVRQATRQRGRELERLDFYDRLRRAAS